MYTRTAVYIDEKKKLVSFAHPPKRVMLSIKSLAKRNHGLG